MIQYCMVEVKLFVTTEGEQNVVEEFHILKQRQQMEGKESNEESFSEV